MATTRFPKDTTNIQHNAETFFLLKPDKSSHEGTHPCQKQLSKRPPKWMPESGRRFSKTFKHTTPEAPSKASDEEFRRAMCEKGGDVFPQHFPRTPLIETQLYSRTRRIREMFFLRAQQSISKDAHTKHLEGCTQQSTSKDALRKTSRR